MSSTTTQVTKAVPFAVSSPFDSDPGADIVLRSCDKYEFRARKAILSFGSSFFNDMFTLPQPKEGEHDISIDDGSQLPSIELSETGLTIDALLQYCYPLPNPPVEKLDLSALVIRAAEKYDMAIVVKEMIAAMHDRRSTHPDILLFLYRRACDYRQETEAREYAWECLTLSYPSIVKHGQGLSSDNALPHLIEYHHAVSKKIGVAMQDFYYISILAKDMWRSCSTCNMQGSSEPKWWRNHLALSVQEICTNGPRSGHILCGKNYVSWQGLCHQCLILAFRFWDSFEEEFNKYLDRKARTIVFILPWKL